MAVDRDTGDIAGHGLAQSFDNPLAGTTSRRAPTASATFSAALSVRCCRAGRPYRPFWKRTGGTTSCGRPSRRALALACSTLRLM
jgi:hypothetical protein